MADPKKKQLWKKKKTQRESGVVIGSKSTASNRLGSQPKRGLGVGMGGGLIGSYPTTSGSIDQHECTPICCPHVAIKSNAISLLYFLAL